ncbi:phospholipase D family protein [Arthrobacter sp. MSA 4-2]|uniref:phospholipase D family protein n=1 Tax=Arthrobacter sp. MSA 4-2 TaxID=2794349 RepID=UPI0018E7D881|nr:phospholipase D family protein [Arthrobacter sp. MSA 4-2]MBJ2119414.1 phospholipase D family protein [Arthrobacter sp. MSA 4-2]
MLEAANRQALTQQLRPPAGFRLSHAVGTTFTLDMTSALSVPLSFVSGSGEEFTNPVAVLSALRKVSDRVDIFCQAGHIKAPADASDLLALLEPMVHQVSVKRGLFHPKIWLLEFENDTERRYRFLCSSRNLTADASWDLLVRLDGEPVEDAGLVGPDSGPLARFIAGLPDLCTVTPDEERLARVGGLASRLASVRWDLPEDIHHLAFRPMGTGENFEQGSIVAHLRDPENFIALNKKTGDAAFLGREKLVVSPFLDDTLIGRLQDKWTQNLAIYSRGDQVDLLSRETVGDDRTSFKAFDELGIPESAESGLIGNDESGNQLLANDLTGLHAKAYFCDYDHFTYALLGSANATEAGFTRNVEFLLEMRGAQKRLGVKRIKESLKDVPFTDYLGSGGEARSEDDEAALKLENALRDAAAQQFVLDAVPDDAIERAFTVSVEHGWSPKPEFTAKIRLLSIPQLSVVEPAEVQHLHVFHAIPLADVTPFLVLTLEDPRAGLSKSTVIQGSLRTDPPGRLDEIVARQLDDPQKLRQFLLLFLIPEDALPALGTGTGWFAGSGFGDGSSAGLFEAIVGAMAGPDARSIFPELEVVIDRLLSLSGDDPEVQRLHALWTAATEALKVGDIHGV